MRWLAFDGLLQARWGSGRRRLGSRIALGVEGRGSLVYRVGAAAGYVAGAHDLRPPQLELVRRGERTDGHDEEHGPYQTNFFVMDEHCGTHFDAPTHFDPPEGSGLTSPDRLETRRATSAVLEDLMEPPP